MAKIADSVNVKNLTLITGGARSGKSAFAETLAQHFEGDVWYIATMEELHGDLESAARIKGHRVRRPRDWQTLEVPFDVHENILALPHGIGVCLIDCLSLYVANLLMRSSSLDMNEAENEVNKASDLLLTAIEARPDKQFIVVTNEVGWGIVPENPLARLYRDILGLTNQRFAQAAGQVWLSCAGLQIKLKPQ